MMERALHSHKSVLRFSLALILLSIASFAPAGFAASDGCKPCEGRGIQACSKHLKSLAEFEYEVEYCSEIAECETCAGTGWVACPKCQNREGQAWIDSKLITLREAREELAWIEEGIKRPVPSARSRHFIIAWELEKLRGAKKVKGAHGLMHLYLRRLDELMSSYSAVVGAKPEQFKKRLAMLVWANKQDQMLASEEFCGNESEFAAKQLGAEARISLCGSKAYYKNDEELYRTVVHEFGHLMPSAQTPAGWVGNLNGGWLDAGFAHWFEERTLGACETVCFVHSYYSDQVRSHKWRKEIKKMEARDKLPEVPLVLAQNSETLNFEFHLLSFSFVDFLIDRDPERFAILMKRMRSRSPTRDALFEAFQLSLTDFEEEWRTWVQQNY